MTVTIALLNNHFPAGWMNLPADLKVCLPFTFKYQRMDVDIRGFFDATRGQYHSPSLLAELVENCPPDSDKIVGVTSVDLFIPVLTFVFGEAQLCGKGALVSSYRLQNRFYGLPDDEELQYKRLLKEVLHELGHTLGLIHCPDYKCVMHASTYVEDSDLKEARFCGLCRAKMETACNP